MKVLAISGGSKNGSNDCMAKEALMGAKEQGAEIEFVRLLDLNLKPCTGCISCVNSLMSGGNGDCVIKDDYKWLEEKILDADALIFAMPVFEKGVPGIMHTLQDRLCGPAHDTGINIVAGKIAEQMGKPGPDPRKFKKKVVSYIGIGGSDWNARVACDFDLAAMSGMWIVVENVAFQWAKSIIIQDENVAKCREIGVNIAKAAADVDNAKRLGDQGVCPCCHNRNFHIFADGRAECEVCGIIGRLVFEGENVRFDFPKEMWEHAHTLIPGKMKHMDDIYRNETQLVEDKKKPEFKQRVQAYKEFISASKPE